MSLYRKACCCIFPLLLSISRKDLGKLSLIYLLGKVLEVAGKVLPITFKSGKAFKNSRKGFFPKIPWERNGKGMDSVLLARGLSIPTSQHWLAPAFGGL